MALELKQLVIFTSMLGMVFTFLNIGMNKISYKEYIGFVNLKSTYEISTTDSGDQIIQTSSVPAECNSDEKKKSIICLNTLKQSNTFFRGKVVVADKTN